MARYTVRTVTPHDFSTLMALEADLFGSTSDGVLGPYYVRLCCDFFADTCFVIEVKGVAVGYLLSFVREREVYCTTLGILPAYQGTRALLTILQAFVTSVAKRVDVCWFTVEEDNAAARALHTMLGAEEVGVREDFYGRGHPRIVSRIDRRALGAAAARFERLGLLNGVAAPPMTQPASRGLWCQTN